MQTIGRPRLPRAGFSNPQTNRTTRSCGPNRLPLCASPSVEWLLMMSPKLLVGLSLLLLGGCAEAERVLLAISPDQEQGRTAKRLVDARPKTKIAKQSQTQPPSPPVIAAETI